MAQCALFTAVNLSFAPTHVRRLANTMTATSGVTSPAVDKLAIAADAIATVIRHEKGLYAN